MNKRIVISGIKFILLLVIGDKTAVRCVVLYKPKIRKIFNYVGITVGTPFFIGATYPIYSNLILNVWRVM